MEFLYSTVFWKLLMVFFDKKTRISCPLRWMRICYCVFLIKIKFLRLTCRWYMGIWRKVNHLRYFMRWNFVYQFARNWRIHVRILNQKAWSWNLYDTCFCLIGLNVEKDHQQLSKRHWKRKMPVTLCCLRM